MSSCLIFDCNNSFELKDLGFTGLDTEVIFCIGVVIVFILNFFSLHNSLSVSVSSTILLSTHFPITSLTVADSNTILELGSHNLLISWFFLSITEPTGSFLGLLLETLGIIFLLFGSLPSCTLCLVQYIPLVTFSLHSLPAFAPLEKIYGHLGLSDFLVSFSTGVFRTGVVRSEYLFVSFHSSARTIGSIVSYFDVIFAI